MADQYVEWSSITVTLDTNLRLTEDELNAVHDSIRQLIEDTVTANLPQGWRARFTDD
jgi:hypothetical protein